MAQKARMGSQKNTEREVCEVTENTVQRSLEPERRASEEISRHGARTAGEPKIHSGGFWQPLPRGLPQASPTLITLTDLHKAATAPTLCDWSCCQGRTCPQKPQSLLCPSVWDVNTTAPYHIQEGDQS